MQMEESGPLDELMLNFEKSLAPAFLKSPSGMARNNPDPLAADCQLAIAILKRAGLGEMYLEAAGSHPAYNAGSLAGTNAKPTGPFFAVSSSNSVRGDLYLSCVIELTWSSGATCSRTITYDIDYGDMTVVDAYSWQSGSTQTNVDSGYAQLITFDTHPVAPTGYSYERSGSYFSGSEPTYTQSLNSTNTIATMTWSGATDRSGVVHFGATLKITLSNKKTYRDYADASVSMLNSVTFNDEVLLPSKTYAIAGSFRTAGNYYLRWLKGWNAPPPASNWTSWTTNLVILRSRTTGTGFTFKVFGDLQPFVSFYSGDTYYFQWLYSPWTNVAYIQASAGVAIPLPKNILCAYGLPMDSQTRIGFPSSDLSPATQALLTPYIASVKSRMRSDADMSANGKKYLYNETANTWTTINPPQAYLPNGPRDMEFNPAVMGSAYGYVVAQIEKARYCRPFFDSFGSYQPFQTITKSFGSSQSFKSVTTNKNLGIPGNTANALENVAATWSLESKTGGIVDSDLVVASDQKSAVFNANHHGTCRLKCSYPNTAVYMPLITVP